MSTEFADQAAYAALENEVAAGEPSPGEGEPYTPPSQEPFAQGEPQQQQQQYGPPIPDQNEDPIGHFDARQRAVEGHLQNEQFWNHISKSEDQLRNEFDEGDYDAACEHLQTGRMRELESQFPDGSQQAHVVAYRHGFQNAAQLRAAIMQNDAVTVARHAMANGIAPAASYYHLAMQRGYRPQTVMTRSFRNHVMKNIDSASDEEFDKFWKNYERTIKSVEER